MKIAVIGTGYVGLVTGTCLAETGNDVTCIDNDRRKIDVLNRGHVPIYEPGLAELVARNVAGGRLRFTVDEVSAVKKARLVFVAVGTPPADDGSVDLKALWSVVDSLAPHLGAECIVVCKSTVPVGTNAKVAARLKELTGRDVDVASNPEFLKEGMAIDDFMKPDRVVIGVRRPEVADVLSDLYGPYLRTDKPLLAMSPESAEMTKYVSNAMLATKISFINEMANVCERVGADINDVRRGIGHDSRIGFAFLFPGAGYGGSCFPKDVRALAALARSQAVAPRILEAVHEVNEHQKSMLAQKSSSTSPASSPTRRLPSGAWPSSRAPTTSAKRPRWRSSNGSWSERRRSASTTPKPAPTSKRSTATGSCTASAATTRSWAPTRWRFAPNGSNSCTPTSRKCAA